MYDEQMIENYSKLEDTFNKALKILEYEELPLNIETLDGILLELDDRIDKSINLSPRERNELFLMDFYNNFLYNRKVMQKN